MLPDRELNPLREVMTSFIIRSHVGRTPPPKWTQDHSCSFCRIISGELLATKVYEDENVIAILDILPLRKGHTLVIPKPHISRLSDLPPEFAAATGKVVSRVARALTEALGNTALNVVCNQEYAQAIPHVHFHIIPAPVFGMSSSSLPDTASSPLTVTHMHQKEFEAREELDDDDAAVLFRKIRAHL